jgi:hypothetical protein
MVVMGGGVFAGISRGPDTYTYLHTYVGLSAFNL